MAEMGGRGTTVLLPPKSVRVAEGVYFAVAADKPVTQAVRGDGDPGDWRMAAHPAQARGVPVRDHLSPALHDPVPAAVVRRSDRNHWKVVQVGRTEGAVVPRVAETRKPPRGCPRASNPPRWGLPQSRRSARGRAWDRTVIVGVPKGKNTAVRPDEPVTAPVRGWRPSQQSARGERAAPALPKYLASP